MAGSTVAQEDFWLTLDGSDADDAPAAYAPTLETTYCPIRFQGQWEDRETGLYYNRFRLYDNLAHQYTSPDPVRILGGFRSHSYAETASKQIDPFGLAPCCYADNPQALFAASRDRCGIDLNATQMREIASTMSRMRRGDASQFVRDGSTYMNDTSIEALPGIPTAALQAGAYTEWTVRSWTGASQGGLLRMVRETNTGRVYFTPNHYGCFIELNPLNF